MPGVVPVNLTAAVEAYNRSAALGNATSQFTMGVLHAHGLLGVRCSTLLHGCPSNVHGTACWGGGEARGEGPVAFAVCVCLLAVRDICRGRWLPHSSCTERLVVNAFNPQVPYDEASAVLNYYFAALGGSVEAQLALGCVCLSACLPASLPACLPPFLPLLTRVPTIISRSPFALCVALCSALT